MDRFDRAADPSARALQRRHHAARGVLIEQRPIGAVETDEDHALPGVAFDAICVEAAGARVDVRRLLDSRERQPIATPQSQERSL